MADSYSSSSDASGGGDDWEGGRGDMDMGGGGIPDFGGVGFGGTETGERAATGTARHRRLNSVVAGKGTRKGLTNCSTKKPLRAPGKAARLLFPSASLSIAAPISVVMLNSGIRNASDL